MATKGHLLYYPEGKHDILLGKELNDILKSKVNSVTKITYQNLKDLRDNSKLTPGALYRITDYQCTTTQENTQSAGHQFDIVLLALSEDKLAEEGWAMMSESNVYDVTFGDEVTKKCWLYTKYQYIEGEGIVDTGTKVVDITTLLGIAIGSDEIEKDDVTKTAIADGYDSTQLTTPDLTYNYFQNSNLSAWKVWYCLDNDKSRFAWADDASEESITPSESESSYVRDTNKDVDGLYAWTNDDSGDSIYTKTTNPIVGDEIYDNEGTSMQLTIGFITGFGRGVIYRLIDEFNNDIKYDFKNIQFKRKLTDGQYDATNGTDTWCYTLNLWYNDMCQDASIVGNTLLNDEGFVSGVRDNVFGYTTAYDVYIEGINTFAFALGDNVILSYQEDNVYLGIYNNTLHGYFNTFGSDFCNNIIDGCYYNIVGNYASNNTIGDGFSSNTIGDSFISNDIGSGFNGNAISDSFVGNKIGGGFSGNNINKNFSHNEIGTGVISTVIDKAFVQYIKIANGVEEVRITTNATTSQSNYLQNFVIGLGVKGISSANRKTITHATVNDTKQTTYLPTNSTTINV